MAKAFSIAIVALMLFSGTSFAIKNTEKVPLQALVANKFFEENMTLSLTSSAFKNGEFIPSKYTCDAENINPPLEIDGVPENAKSLVIIMDDPDVPKEKHPSGVFDHWVLYNISPNTVAFEEGVFDGEVGANGRGDLKYAGPCPPPEYQPTTHRYFFKVYAIDLEKLEFANPPKKQEVLDMIEGHIIEEAELVGIYDRSKDRDLLPGEEN